MTKKDNAFCVICGERKADYLMAKHRNENLNPKFGYCLDCIKEMVDIEENGILHACRLLNIPYIDDMWKTAYQSQPLNPVGKYFQLIAPKKIYKDFLDSEYGREVGSESIKIDDEVIGRWGSGEYWTNEKYIEYETALEDLMRIKKPSSKLEEKRYIENVRLGKRLSEEIENGKATDIKALKATYTQDLKELGLDIETISKDDERTLGMRIADHEKSAPLPDIAPEFQDPDKIMKYVTKYFFIPVKRLFNQATEEEIQSLYDIDKSIDPER